MHMHMYMHVLHVHIHLRSVCRLQRLVYEIACMCLLLIDNHTQLDM